jgi:hypothetical protein
VDGLAGTLLLFGAIAVAIVVPFVIIPEILERRGHNPRSGLVRAIAWVTFLAIVLIPAASSGFLISVTNPADWVLFLVAMIVAILYDYYRLNPGKVPWLRSRT